MEFSPDDIVLVPFPHRDRLAESHRPAVVVSDVNYNRQGDIVVAAITSHAARFATDAPLSDWAIAGLRMHSTVRMLLATIATSRVVHNIGHLSERDWMEVQSRLRIVFGST
jgi:mRNA-degrading endonuclease toxin of MazEF toxin-antitoxin module